MEVREDFDAAVHGEDKKMRASGHKTGATSRHSGLTSQRSSSNPNALS